MERMIFKNCDYKELVAELKEKNIIISHMFPLGSIKPEYLESWIVSTIDKIVALDEYIVYKFKDKLVLFAIFIINFIRFRCDFL